MITNTVLETKVRNALTTKPTSARAMAYQLAHLAAEEAGTVGEIDPTMIANAIVREVGAILHSLAYRGEVMYSGGYIHTKMVRPEGVIAVEKQISRNIKNFVLAEDEIETNEQGYVAVYHKQEK